MKKLTPAHTLKALRSNYARAYDRLSQTDRDHIRDESGYIPQTLADGFAKLAYMERKHAEIRSAADGLKEMVAIARLRGDLKQIAEDDKAKE